MISRIKGTQPKLPKLPDDDELEDGHGGQMSFFEHLDELRQRIMKAFFSLVVGTVIGAVVAARVLDFLQGPYAKIKPDDPTFRVLGPTGGVVAYFRVALLVGGIIAIPVITYQVLMFFLPALTRKERRVLVSSLPAIYGLFLIGVAFSWFILIPPALGFLGGFQPTLFTPEWTADLYIGFVTSLLFWMGVAFETPLVFFVLSIMGFVSAWALLRNWRIAIVGASIAAAVITPTIDPVNMFLVMGPLMALYAISIILVAFGGRLRRN